MKGYSFKSLTNLVLKIFGTKINAGTGLSGGGSLEADRTLSVSYGITAGTATQGNDTRVVNAASNATVNAKEAALEAKKADKAISITASTGLSGGGTLAASRSLAVKYGTAAGTAAQGNDTRLSDSREWTGATISQAEAEAGTATTRKAFTAQRVRQSIVAWWDSITGVFGRDLVTSSSSTVARSKLGLGTAATRDVGTISGQLLAVGSNGYGITSSITTSDWNEATMNGVYYMANIALNAPIVGWLLGRCQSHNSMYCTQTVETFNLGGYPRTFKRQLHNGVWSDWVELHHTGNILTTTGQSSTYPMTQKATTDQLATKAPSSHTHPWAEVSGKPSTFTPSSHTHPWAEVTGQPATATRWPAFTEVTGRPANYPTTWDSVAAKPAQATRWPSLAEVTDKPTYYPTTWASVASKPITNTQGDSTASFMSQRGSTLEFGQPVKTASYVFDKTNNRITSTDIVADLGLEVGDVIQVTGSASNNRIHTISVIENANSIIVNKQHRNQTTKLSLINETKFCTIKRLCKWYSAPSGLGQSMLPFTIDSGSVLINSSNRPLVIYATGGEAVWATFYSQENKVASIAFNTTDALSFNYTSSVSIIIPPGDDIAIIAQAGYDLPRMHALQ